MKGANLQSKAKAIISILDFSIHPKT